MAAATRLAHERFIRQNLPLVAVPGIEEIRIHTAHPGSGLRRLLDAEQAAPPYWAFVWAGGAALARFILDQPSLVAGKRIVDLGSGSGIVAIAAAKAGAASVTACDIDALAIHAIHLNAAANGVDIAVLGQSILDQPPPCADVMLVGDLFYDADLAVGVLGFLNRCRAVGMDVLVGDPGRTPLPRAALEVLATLTVADFGDSAEASGDVSHVYRLRDGN